MKINSRGSLVWMAAISVTSFVCCTKVASTHQKATDSAQHPTDSVIYMLTADSVSIPIRLNEIGDFPAFAKGRPYRLSASAYTFNFRDTTYLHFLNGQRIEGKQKARILRRLKETEIESIRYIPAEQGMEDYGQKAANGILFIETKDRK
ncbi:hypothetical protein Q0590_05655 [Rhodocytophaga aerolata]|uniref:Uncharacterized protein n=1 Tax=Rhodocytophaga aerolata TaxID=455078 RepID=A0ABT8R0W0_9BACT|nr:hypothetical protein [Rhodocytophaga aerolata]MDO1445724.1 hypothetical protein [Rhodocytophaga aerolata]